MYVYLYIFSKDVYQHLNILKIIQFSSEVQTQITVVQEKQRKEAILMLLMLTTTLQLFLMKKLWCLRTSWQRKKIAFIFSPVVEVFEAALTGLLGTLWQVKSQTHGSSSASSSQDPPNVRQRSCSQLSAPDPEPPEPQSASENHQKHEKGE